MTMINELKPAKVFKYFNELSQIPRGSDDEKRISDYLTQFGKDRNLETIQEPCMNVIIKKPATPGYEHIAPVILQGHMDMVCVKREGSNHDFSKDPIELWVDGDFLKAKDTTLGADNGIAVAMSLAILDSDDLQHPALEVLVTVAEETGMDGAGALIPANISGKTLINIDSEEEGVMLASCAGGVNNIVTMPIAWEKASKETYIKLTIKGLLGGHSGMEIIKNRANAIKLMARVMKALEALKVEVTAVNGGEKMNAITKFCSATIGFNKADEAAVNAKIKEMEAMFQNEFAAPDPGIFFEMAATEKPEQVFSAQTLSNFVNFLRMLPNGVQTMNHVIPGLVESSNNIGVLETKADEIRMNNAVRSSVKSLKAEINERIRIAAEMCGAKSELIADYPEWAFQLESPIRELMGKVYKEMTGNEMHVDAIHAGLECGLLTEKVGNIDMVSIGPNLYDVHTPDEKLSISSTERTYKFLVEVLKRMK